MKKIYSTFFALSLAAGALAQICNPTASLILFTNYDGGTLNINLDAPMTNIKIGVCSYEGVNINISGIGASAVAAVAYAGYNGTNIPCGSVINTNITGTPGTSVNTITFAPPASLANPNGNPNIICGYSCSTTTNQGGCNTVDQIEDYFMDLFPGSQVFMHKVQYACWSGTQNVSNGGTCCALATGVTNITIEGFKIYPNPAESTLNVAALNGFKDASFRVYSADGKIVHNKTGLSETIDISMLQSGIYFIEFTDGDYMTRKKFVKN